MTFSSKQIAILYVILSLMISGCSNSVPEQKIIRSTYLENTTKNSESVSWIAPDTSELGNTATDVEIRYGRKLITSTAEFFGPFGKINHFANGMNCQNCHLNAGTKLYANSYCAVFSIYPKFRARSGTVEQLEKRINDCMERSLNGKKLDTLSKEMKALKAYINWVGKEVKKGVSPEGASVVDIPYLERAADQEKGKIAFQKNCISCHGEHGEGKLNFNNITYLYPPLWGNHSYNTAAGLYRLSRFAGFIKSNMPNLQSTHSHPILSDEECWDIAAYVNSMPRPEKKFKNDWPDISKKPVDHPFGPYADHYSEKQHKYGPFKEMATKNK